MHVCVNIMPYYKFDNYIINFVKIYKDYLFVIEMD